MDGGSCGLEGALGVISKGISPDSTVRTDIPLLLEKRRASPTVDETCEEAESEDGSLEAQICMDFSNSISLGIKKCLQKCATFPISSGEEAQQEEPTCLHAEGAVKDAPAYERSLSLPPTLKPISALKGSRRKNGMASLTEECHVKWAPDVYDPPVTSVCHSVTNSYQRRSKPRKKEKNKPKKKQKAKSKKNHQNSIQSSSVLQASDFGLKDLSTSVGQSSPNDLSKHEAVILDYNVGNQEDKCGSSFLRESVAKMHFSFAEAS